MKVTFVHCGPPNECKEYYRNLSLRGAEVTAAVNTTVVMGEVGIAGNHEIHLDVNGKEPYRLIGVDLVNPRNYNVGFRFKELLKVIKESDPDIIHVFNEYHCFPVMQVVLVRNFFLKKKAPIVIYNFQNIDYVNLTNNIKAFATGLIARFNLKNIQGITSANQEGLDIVGQYHETLQMKKIFWPVDISLFSRKNKQDCRRKINVSSDKKIIGYSGRFVREKGLEDLLLALQSMPDVVVLFVGSGEDQSRLQDIVRQRNLTDRVMFRSFVPVEELVDYYNALDCFVLPSRTTPLWKEQYGRVLVEAMACGIPVVGSSSGAIPEVLDGYSNKKIFKEGDVAVLKEILTEMFPKSSIDTDKHFLQRFSQERFADEHFKFYKELLAAC